MRGRGEREGERLQIWGGSRGGGGGVGEGGSIPLHTYTPAACRAIHSALWLQLGLAERLGNQTPSSNTRSHRLIPSPPSPA